MQKLPPDTKAARIALGRVIRAERQERGLSQEKFAELCDVHRNYIGFVERAELSMSFDNLLAIAGALKLTPSELLKRADL